MSRTKTPDHAHVTSSTTTGSSALRAAVALLALAVTSLFAAGTLRADPGYLVAAPDRGFLGNEEARELRDDLRETYPATELWIVTDERTEDHLRSALEKLRAREGVDRVVVLPLFLSRHHALYGRARSAAEAVSDGDLRWAEPLGESYLAEEILFDRLEALSEEPESEQLVLVGAGAGSASSADSIRSALAPLAERATRKFGMADSARVAVLYHGSAPDSLVGSGLGAVGDGAEAVASAGATPVVVPFGFARRYTAMMSDWNWLGRSVDPHGAAYSGHPVLPHDAAADWLRRAATRHRTLDRDEVGVIFVPHGSDYNWNETMREGIAPVAEDYMSEEAFSMVDPVVLERAIRDLEDRGAKAAVVVRIFSLESSFREKAEYVLGLRRDHPRFPHRIRTHLELHTLGGIETSPQLMDALADRVRSLSEDPSRETVILLAHGAGDSARHQHWMDNLEEIAGGVAERTGDRFRDYRYHAWREDWPEHREESLETIRRMVREASEGDGVALVVPQRTAARGPAREYLEDLEFRYGTGFAPHPAFADWLRETVETGIEEVTPAETGPRDRQRH